jgi:hypothetical protein
MAAAMERMKDLGVLMGKGGLHGSCFRIMCARKSMHFDPPAAHPPALERG